MPYTQNLLLESLPAIERQVLAPYLSPVELKQHQVLFDLHEPVTAVYFPFDAVVSLVVPLSTGELVEGAIVGRDGIVGAGAALAGRISLNRAVAQIGGRALQCRHERLRAVMEERPHIRSVIHAHEQALFAQAQQSAACNVTHNIESRLARWLLRAADLHGSDHLALTQESLAAMLGVRRTSVSLVAHTLQQAGMVRYKRGHIRLLNIEALLETSCECYAAVKTNYDAFLRHPPPHVTPPQVEKHGGKHETDRHRHRRGGDFDAVLSHACPGGYHGRAWLRRLRGEG